MRNSLLPWIATAAAITIAFTATVHAQNTSQTTDKPAPAKKQKPAPTAKPTHRVWTEDNIGAVRRPADVIIDAQARQAQNAAAAQEAQEASERQAAAADLSKPPTKKAPLSQAKSVEDADAKITWEKKDIQGQEETIANLQQRLDSATPEERAHLQQLIEQHKQYLADTRKEMQGLEEQKKQFQNPKKPAAPAEPAPAPADAPANTSAEAQPPSQ